MIKKIGFCILTTSIIATGLFAKTSESLVDTYMDLSGAKVIINSLGAQITSNIQQTNMMYGNTTDEKEILFLEKVFNGNEGVDIIESYLVEHFNDQNIKRLINYYKTPLGQKVTQAGIEVMSASAQSDMLKFMSNLQTNPPSSERVAMIKAFNSELEMVEMAKGMFIEMFSYMAKEDKKLYEQMDQIADMMSQIFEKQMFISSLYTYRDMSDEELQKVISFYKTEAGKNEVKIVREAILKMLKNGFARALQSQT